MIDFKRRLYDKKCNKLLASALVICCDLYKLDKDFAKMIYKVGVKYNIPSNILHHYNNGSSILTIYKLANPVLLRPCKNLQDIMMANTTVTLPDEFNVIDSEPSMHDRMVFSYRNVYDALYTLNLLNINPDGEGDRGYSKEAAKTFLEATTLYQLNKEYFSKK